MPRPISQYFSLPFSWQCIRSPPCVPELCRMPVARHRRPGKEEARAGRHIPPGTAPEPPLADLPFHALPSPKL